MKLDGLRCRFVSIACVSLAASCVADNDQPLVFGAAVEVAPSVVADVAIVHALQNAFPHHADRVLGRTQAQSFIAFDGGFARGPSHSLAMHLDVHLPRDPRQAIRLTAPGGHEIRVYQKEVHNEGILADHAVAYRRPRGTSFWSVTSGGAEEWLHLEAGAVTSDLDIAAEWEIEGATPVLMNNAVALMDDKGVARAWVTAPEAFGAGERPIDVRLSVDGQRIELFADARGEEVLLDPGWVAVAPTMIGRALPSVNTLPNGSVMVAGGHSTSGYEATAEIYYPATNIWASAPSMLQGRYGQRSSSLMTGSVLIAGGDTTGGYTASALLGWQGVGGRRIWIQCNPHSRCGNL